MTTHPAVAFPFRLDSDGRNPDKIGHYAWVVGLSDGREVVFFADRISVNHGHLYAWIRRFGVEAEQIGFVLAPGAWIDVYAASAQDGSPICVDTVPALPESKGL